MSGGLDELVELAGIDGELADALGQFLCGHRILIQREAECGFVKLLRGDGGRMDQQAWSDLGLSAAELQAATAAPAETLQKLLRFAVP